MDHLFSCTLLKVVKTTFSKVYFVLLLLCVCTVFVGCNSKVKCPICDGYKSFESSDGEIWTCSYCDQDGMMTKDEAKQILNVLNQSQYQNGEIDEDSQQNTNRGNCKCCNGTGVIQTSSGTASCSICGGDGDFSISDGDRVYNNSRSSDGNGSNKGLSPHNVECSTCQGTGYCSRCKGTGVVYLTEYAANDYTTCPVCDGAKRCQSCSGSGVSHVEYR